MRVAVIGLGNVGRFAVEAVQAAEDMELAGIVRRQSSAPKQNIDTLVVTDIRDLGPVDVALLCTPSRTVPPLTKEILGLGINTVDCYDIHGELVNLRRELATVAKENNAVAVLAAGWDPGTDSVIRALLEAMAPKGITYTNFGPGMSMGHTTAVKALPGVKDALSMTIPIGTGLHRRIVYVVLEEGAQFSGVERTIKALTSSMTKPMKTGSRCTTADGCRARVTIERKGCRATHNQLFQWDMRLTTGPRPKSSAARTAACNNPEPTPSLRAPWWISCPETGKPGSNDWSSPSGPADRFPCGAYSLSHFCLEKKPPYSKPPPQLHT